MRRFADVPAFSADKLGFLERKAAAAEGAVPLRLGTPTLLLTTPADVEHVLLGGHKRYIKTQRMTSARGRRLLGRGVLTSTGDDHLAKRRVLAAGFQRRAVGAHARALVASAEARLTHWRTGATLDVGEEMATIAREALLRTLLGVDAPEVQRLEPDVATRQHLLDRYFTALLPFPELLPTRLALRHRAARTRIEAALGAAIRMRRTDPRDDLLSELVATGLPDDRLVEEALMLTVTGSETLGAALTWVWHALAEHPAVEERVDAEVAQLPSDRTLALADTTGLAATDRVLAETLRLWPPTWIIVRVATADDELPSGTRVASGSRLYLSPWVAHHDPRSFPDPTRFDPDRFTDEERVRRPELAYFPFGAGVHLCLGKPLAQLELLLVVATVARRFRLRHVDAEPVRPRPGLVLAPAKPLRMRVESR